MSFIKLATVSAISLGVLASACSPSIAGNGQNHFRKLEGFGRHSGFGGNGGLGRGGYHFGDKFEDSHPRRSEVLGRDNRMNYAINRDKGQLGGNYSSLENQQRRIRQQEQADARANGGHITAQEQRQLNGEERSLRNQVSQDYTGQGSAFGGGQGRGEGFGPNSGFGGNGGLGRGGYHFGDKFEDNHPRRSEVLGRDNSLNSAINRNRGDLGGNYNTLKTEDRSIRQQEQADARANGGYITTQQQQALNQEENQLRQQVTQDRTVN